MRSDLPTCHMAPVRGQSVYVPVALHRENRVRPIELNMVRIVEPMAVIAKVPKSGPCAEWQCDGRRPRTIGPPTQLVHPWLPPVEIADHTASGRRFISGQCERYLGTLDAAGNLDHADSLCRGERPAVCPTVWPHRSRRAGARGRTCSSDIEVRQRACRRYAASPPRTAAGRRTFMPAEPKRWVDLAETGICRARRLAPARSPSMSTKSLITEVSRPRGEFPEHATTLDHVVGAAAG